jgi:hypothetical protein
MAEPLEGGVLQLKAAGHAQVDHEGAGAQAEQKILCPTLEARYREPRQHLGQARVHGPAEARLKHLHLSDALTLHMGGQASTGGFDFG